jgi:hypothetical protein
MTVPFSPSLVARQDRVPAVEAARRLNCERRTVIRMIERGAVRGSNEPSGRWWVEAASLDEHLGRRQAAAAASRSVFTEPAGVDGQARTIALTEALSSLVVAQKMLLDADEPERDLVAALSEIAAGMQDLGQGMEQMSRGVGQIAAAAAHLAAATRAAQKNREVAKVYLDAISQLTMPGHLGHAEFADWSSPPSGR